jgi:hypothetical protein
MTGQNQVTVPAGQDLAARHPARQCLCQRFTRDVATAGAGLEVSVVRFSVAVGLFHPLLSAGLSRRFLTDSHFGHARNSLKLSYLP